MKVFCKIYIRKKCLVSITDMNYWYRLIKNLVNHLNRLDNCTGDMDKQNLH